MSSANVRIALRGTLIAGCLTFAAVGCSDDDGSANPSVTAGNGAAGMTSQAGRGAGAGASGRSGAGGAGSGGSGSGGRAGTGTAGTAGSSGTGTSGAGAGGMSMPGEEDDAGVPMDASMPPMNEDDAGACGAMPPMISVEGFPKCNEQICPAQDSVCIATDLLEQLDISSESLAMLADCDETTKCVPTAIASQAGRGILPKCESLLGAEGRCLSTCVPQVALQASQLPRANCQGTELCAPCYDPRTGEPTGACTQGCDPGPTEPPKRFPSCCGGRGMCVPPSLAADQAPNLNRDTCSASELCAPNDLTDPTYKPASCNSLEGAEGRCLSTCIGGAVAQQLDRLPTAGCGEDEVCAPCFDPITGEATGACTINGDAPARAPITFQRCCGSGDDAQGVCVTPELAGDQAEILRQESCSADRLCAPVEKAQDPNYRFPVCYGLLGAGACVPECILNPAQSLFLTRAMCEAGELCAPCTILGQPTGACD